MTRRISRGQIGKQTRAREGRLQRVTIGMAPHTHTCVVHTQATNASHIGCSISTSICGCCRRLDIITFSILLLLLLLASDNKSRTAGLLLLLLAFAGRAGGFAFSASISESNMAVANGTSSPTDSSTREIRSRGSCCNQCVSYTSESTKKKQACNTVECEVHAHIRKELL